MKSIKDNDIINLEELASGTSFEFMSRGFHSGDSQRMDQNLIESLIGFQDDLINLGQFFSHDHSLGTGPDNLVLGLSSPGPWIPDPDAITKVPGK